VREGRWTEDIAKIVDVKNRKRGREDGWECVEKMEDERCRRERREDGWKMEDGSFRGGRGREDGWKMSVPTGDNQLRASGCLLRMVGDR
jgi:hypothetical protein